MNIHRKHIDRIVITGLYEDSEKAFNYCARNGYHIVRSGPMQITRMRYDTSRFKIVAERERRTVHRTLKSQRAAQSEVGQ